MTTDPLAEARENQAQIWDAHARDHLTQADEALHLAHQWRTGVHDNQLREQLNDAKT